MKKYIIRQTIDLDLQWVIEANSKEEALENAWGNFDSAKVIDICALDWNKPWDAEEVEGSEPRPMTQSELKNWQALGIL